MQKSDMSYRIMDIQKNVFWLRHQALNDKNGQIGQDKRVD